ncbi:MAG: magnesium-translocating P-type ATPase, partial [Firmicutes bacterium]|nr:magnesium-translocating P-type ATPase [Bacillota bacterium]
MLTKKKKEQKKIISKGNERLLHASRTEVSDLLSEFDNNEGFNEEQVENMRYEFGKNVITHYEKESVFMRLLKAFINPFTVILIVLAIVSLFTGVIFAEPGEQDFTQVIIVFAMVTISGILRFVQETKSSKAADELKAMIKTTTCVLRAGEGKIEIPLSDVVVGDIIYLAAGDMIPADVRILTCKDLFVSESSLTGESNPVEKVSAAQNFKHTNSLELSNLAFMGTNVVSGSASCIAIAVGDDTHFGTIAASLTQKKEATSFEKGINSVSWVLIRFMMIMVPVVFLVNGIVKGLLWQQEDSWIQALLFGLSVAVGLTPEMLPMIVTTGLAKGAVRLSKKKTVVKNINSIQNFGAMDILCTDKTGTLTMDEIVLEAYLDIHGNPDLRILRHAFLNSHFQTGMKNLMDKAILDHKNDEGFKEMAKKYTKVDEIPFDFTRRRMSVVIKDKEGKTQLITKGAVEEMLAVSSYAEYHGKVEPLTDELRKYILEKVDDLNDDGMRVIAVAQKTNPSPVGAFSAADESDMVLMGYLALLDPPKESTEDAIKALNEHGVGVKILTGDNDKVTRCICRQVGLQVDKILLGSDIESMSDKQLGKAAEEINVFAKLSPQQKARIITALRDNGHSVGYMGDGINDAAAMTASDVGISVDTAVDIAKESADVILLEKDLMVLEKGIVEGRKTYANMIKYIKMTASSNFGNMFSVLAASAFLPFIPMMPIHLIVLNLIYDLSCTAIPWDNVDKEFIAVPRKWDASNIGKFMFWIGPTSSVFDITTYILMFFWICPNICGDTWANLKLAGNTEMIDKFQMIFWAGWFV